MDAATIDQETVKEANEAVPASPVASKPDTPPPKEDAFEQFKNGSGSEIHGILIHNKGEWWTPVSVAMPHYCYMHICIMMLARICQQAGRRLASV